MTNPAPDFDYVVLLDTAGQPYKATGTGGTSMTDQGDFTPGASSATPISAMRDDSTPSTLSEGQQGVVRATEYRALHVNLRDESGGEVSVGGGTQYDEDTAHAADEKLTMAGVVRKDTAASLVDSDSDRTELIVDASGRLHVNVGASALPTGAATSAKQDTLIGHVDGLEALLTTIESNQLPDGHNVTIDNPGDIGGGTQYTEGDTDATPTGVAILWRDNADSDTLHAVSDEFPLPVTASIDTTGLALESKQDDAIAHLASIETAVEAIQAGQLPDSHNVTVDNASIPVTGTFWQATQPVSGTVTANAGTNLNTSALALESGGNLAGAAASLAVLDDWDESDRAKVNPIVGQAGITGGAGSVAANTPRVTHASDDPAVTALQIMDDWDNGASDGASVSGDVAHDSADAGEPVKVGAKAYSPDGTTPGTAVAEADRTHLKTDLDGLLYVQPMNPQNWSYHDDDTSAVTTDGTVHADPGDGFAVFITDIVFSIGAATASSIFLEEGSTKILGPYYLEAIAGRGLSIHFATPKRCTASTAILVTNTGSISFSIDIMGFVAAV